MGCSCQRVWIFYSHTSSIPLRGQQRVVVLVSSMADRPSAAQPVSKRRAGEQVTKNDVELEEDEDADGEARDPGSWAPVTDEAIKRRRKVHVRRGGAGTAEPVAVPEAAAPAAPGGNPFAGIALTAPSGQPPTSNPFANITLVAPAEKGAAEPAQPAATPQDTDQASGPPKAASDPGAQAEPAAAPPADAPLATKDDAAAPAPAAEAAPAAAGEASAAATQAGSAGEPTPAGGASEKEEAAGASATPAGFGAVKAPAAGAAGGFSSFGSLAAGKRRATGGMEGSRALEAWGSGGSFSGFAGFGTGTLGAGTGGFGGLAGTSGGFGTGSFSFGTAAFPPVAAPAPFSLGPSKPSAVSGSDSTRAVAADGEGGEGEGGEDGEGGEGGGEGVQLFGNGSVKPLVQLPEQAKRTGEEEEQAVFSADGSLFEFDTAAAKWRERGKGEFKPSCQPSPAQPSPAQPSPAQPSPAQPSPAQPSPAQPSPAQPSPAQPSPAQPSPAQPSPAQPSPAQPSPAQPSPAQPSPAQPSPAQPSPAQPSPAQPSPARHTALCLVGMHAQVNKADKGMARMVMRQAANLRLLLNAKVYPGMPVQLMPSNVGVTFGVVNAVASHQSESGNADKKETTDEASNDVAAASASTAAKPTTWALKIKNPERGSSWLDRDCNAALNMQRIGESRWRPLELCWWPEQTALPAKGKEYPGLGYKRLRDKPSKPQQQQQLQSSKGAAGRGRKVNKLGIIETDCGTSWCSGVTYVPVPGCNPATGSNCLGNIACANNATSCAGIHADMVRSRAPLAADSSTCANY
ncbi:hypothetical protein QJQ45_027136 [Haematococcus lacustris]|nr:hypothetical protein QJQ45_027136 [Haematococcus lacustris]